MHTAGPKSGRIHMSTLSGERHMFRTFGMLASLIALGACSDNAVAPVGVVGTYTLTAVNGAPVPAALVRDVVGTFYLTRATIELRADGTYTALTCYDGDPRGCAVSRAEIGTYTIAVGGRNVVSLKALDGYARALTITPGTLTERGGGDFECVDAAERAAGRVCVVLVYSKS